MFTLSRRCREPFLKLKMIEHIKKASSKWIKSLHLRYRGFFWQRGYAAFLVSPSQLDALLKYVETQKEHHRTRTFQEEYRELLRSAWRRFRRALRLGWKNNHRIESRCQRWFMFLTEFLGRCPKLR